MPGILAACGVKTKVSSEKTKGKNREYAPDGAVGSKREREGPHLSDGLPAVFISLLFSCRLDGFSVDICAPSI